MAEKKKSMLYKLKPIIDKMPAVTPPEGHVHFKTKMAWTLTILVLYFLLTNVLIYGLGRETLDAFSSFRAILAGASGSVMHLGIGPIVTGSIIMQLFTGAGIIKLDLTDEEDKAIYQGSQKVVVLIMIVVESVPQVYGYLEPSPVFIVNLENSFLPGTGLGWARFFIVLQLFVGSYLVFLMDEVVSKWGIGSGISMFIAAGVSQSIFTGTFNYEAVNSSQPLSTTNPPSGVVFKTAYLTRHFSYSEIVNGGGFEQMFIQQPNPIIALVGTILIFLIVTYAESSRIELPLTHARVRGARGRYPIRLIYASNIPVILMAALLANVNMFTLLLYTHPSFKTIPLLGSNWMIGKFEPGETKPSAGGAWYLSQLNGVHDWLLPLLNEDKYGHFMLGHEAYQLIIRVIVYVSVMALGSMLFAKFWIQTTNMGPEKVAEQIQSSGMQIPGFRREPRAMKKVLDRFIPAVTSFSGLFVGLLAAGADMIGTIGNTSGTGVLLTVGIMIRLYEDIGKEQMMEMHPVLRSFFGEE